MLRAGSSQGRFPVRSLDFLNLANSSSRTIALGPTQPLIYMNIRSLSGGKWWPARNNDNLTSICEPIFLENVGASKSHNPMRPHDMLQR
jgi:hypothetical protein